MKKCTGCKELKSLSKFHKSRNHKDGLKPRCKTCRNTSNKKHREANLEYFQKWRDDHKDSVKEYNDKYREKNKEVLEAKKKEYVEANKDLVSERKKAWYEENKKRVIANKKRRRQTNIQVRLAENLRVRLYNALKRKRKLGSAVRDLGCTISELKKYLESKFEPNMSWDNYGKWHIDHIVPFAVFDLTDREQLKKACHYTNLQPLWAEDNLKKGGKLPTIKGVRK